MLAQRIEDLELCITRYRYPRQADCDLKADNGKPTGKREANDGPQMDNGNPTAVGQRQAACGLKADCDKLSAWHNT